MTPQSLRSLAERVERCTGVESTLDIQVEIALFRPDADFVAIRPNDAGTKVIYTTPQGADRTHWPRDWTMSALDRHLTAAALKARAHAIEGGSAPGAASGERGMG